MEKQVGDVQAEAVEEELRKRGCVTQWGSITSPITDNLVTWGSSGPFLMRYASNSQGGPWGNDSSGHTCAPEQLQNAWWLLPAESKDLVIGPWWPTSDLKGSPKEENRRKGRNRRFSTKLYNTKQCVTFGIKILWLFETSTCKWRSSSGNEFKAWAPEPCSLLTLGGAGHITWAPCVSIPSSVKWE